MAHIQDFEFNPLSPSFIEDPHPTYRALRNLPTAAWSELDQAWLITRYEDVSFVLQDHETFSSDDRKASRQWDDRRPLRDQTVIESDRPRHSRLRRSISQSFTPARTAALRPRIEMLVDKLLDRGLRDGCIELMEQLAIPLALTITCEILGMDTEMMPILRKWADSEMNGIYPGTSAAHRERLLQTSETIHAYFREAIERERVRESAQRQSPRTTPSTRPATDS